MFIKLSPITFLFVHIITSAVSLGNFERMSKFQQNPIFFKEIQDVREKNGIKQYQVVWKQNSWVSEAELEYCKDAIDNFNVKSGRAASIKTHENHEPKESIGIDKPDGAIKGNKCGKKGGRSQVLQIQENPQDDSQVEALAKAVGKLDIKTDIEVTPEDQAKHREVMDSIKTPDWYMSLEKTEKVNSALKSFNDKYCRNPEKKIMARAKNFHDIMMKKLREELNKNDYLGCQKIEFTGSTYEGLKLTGDGLEFDVMILLNGGDRLELQPVPDEEGFRFLTPTDPKDPMFEKLLNDKGQISPKKLKSKYFSALQKFIDSENDYKDRVKLINHGPAIQIDVKTKEGDKLWYSVDTVPTYEVKETKDSASFYYVTKSDKGTPDSWRRSFSREEKDLLRSIDQGNGCRREVIRTLKALFKKQPTLSKISSYILKTSLFHASNYMSDDVSWGVKEYPNRVFDMLGVVQGYLEKKWLPHYHIPTQNLLKNYEEKTLENIKNCIKGMRSSEKKFLNAFDSTTADLARSSSSSSSL